MNMLVNRTAIDLGPVVSLADAKLHFRIDHSDEDTAIAGLISAAAFEIENFGQLALLKQTIRVNVFDPITGETYLKLPIGPARVDQTPTVTIDGTAFTEFSFEGGNRPFIRWHSAFLDLSPSRLSIEYEAGFDAVPDDLRLAVMDQALVVYEGRGVADERDRKSSPHMARIGARYRGVRL